MTEKQKKIVTTALHLFAKEGYHNTSTSRIAKEAGVSEGLIFRHFNNKEGLLNAILEMGQLKAQEYFNQVINLEDPKALIAAILETPFQIEDTEHDFWRLLYALKWQQFKYNRATFDLLNEVSQKAFEKLGYENPKAEAQLLEVFLDGAATVLLLKPEGNYTHLLRSIKQKFNVE